MLGCSAGLPSVLGMFPNKPCLWGAISSSLALSASCTAMLADLVASIDGGESAAEAEADASQGGTVLSGVPFCSGVWAGLRFRGYVSRSNGPPGVMGCAGVVWVLSF